jgi:hypothetical protein
MIRLFAELSGHYRALPRSLFVLAGSWLVFLAAPPGRTWPPLFGRFLRHALRLLSSEATKQLPVNPVVCVHSFEAP